MELEHALLAVVLAQSNEGIHMVDTAGITKYYNTAAATMDGLDPEEVLGKHVLAVFPSLDKGTSTLLQVARSGRPIVDRQQSYTNVKGAGITTINTTLPIIGQTGALLGAVEIARDISGIRKLTEEIIDLRRRLQVEDPAAPAEGANYHFGDIIGENEALRRLIKKAALAAHSDSPLMVVGETGTGKELLVQSIHNESLRRSRPFVPQNCAALPDTLLDAILFGTVKGSFTGAGDRPGLFELANGGTLFLDELNAMPLHLQAKLLRVLEGGELRRLGDVRARRVDVRIIAAMSADPRQTLRGDLFYRLNVVALTLPPLRQRKEDIPLLCKHFIARHNQRFGTGVEGLTREAEKLLAGWHWPGNVRELGNCIEACLNFRSKGKIRPEDLPEEYTRPKEPEKMRAELARREKTMVFNALAATEGNISRAADLLGIPRQTLQRRMKKYRWHETCISTGQSKG